MQTSSAPECVSCPILQSTVFRQCPLETLLELAGNKTSHSYNKGDLIFLEKMSVTGVYCQHSGRVGLSRTDAAGETHLLDVTTPGMLLGFREAFREGRYMYSAVALEDSVLCFIPLEELRSIVAKHPSILVEVMQSLCTRIAALEEHLEVE